MLSTTPSTTISTSSSPVHSPPPHSRRRRSSLSFSFSVCLLLLLLFAVVVSPCSAQPDDSDSTPGSSPATNTQPPDSEIESTITTSQDDVDNENEEVSPEINDDSPFNLLFLSSLPRIPSMFGYHLSSLFDSTTLSVYNVTNSSLSIGSNTLAKDFTHTYHANIQTSYINTLPYLYHRLILEPLNTQEVRELYDDSIEYYFKKTDLNWTENHIQFIHDIFTDNNVDASDNNSELEGESVDPEGTLHFSSSSSSLTLALGPEPVRTFTLATWLSINEEINKDSHTIISCFDENHHGGMKLSIEGQTLSLHYNSAHRFDMPIEGISGSSLLMLSAIHNDEDQKLVLRYGEHINESNVELELEFASCTIGAESPAASAHSPSSNNNQNGDAAPTTPSFLGTITRLTVWNRTIDHELLKRDIPLCLLPLPQNATTSSLTYTSEESSVTLLEAESWDMIVLQESSRLLECDITACVHNENPEVELTPLEQHSWAEHNTVYGIEQILRHVLPRSPSVRVLLLEAWPSQPIQNTSSLESWLLHSHRFFERVRHRILSDAMRSNSNDPLSQLLWNQLEVVPVAKSMQEMITINSEFKFDELYNTASPQSDSTPQELSPLGQYLVSSAVFSFLFEINMMSACDPTICYGYCSCFLTAAQCRGVRAAVDAAHAISTQKDDQWQEVNDDAICNIDNQQQQHNQPNDGAHNNDNHDDSNNDNGDGDGDGDGANNNNNGHESNNDNNDGDKSASGDLVSSSTGEGDDSMDMNDRPPESDADAEFYAPLPFNPLFLLIPLALIALIGFGIYQYAKRKTRWQLVNSRGYDADDLAAFELERAEHD